FQPKTSREEPRGAVDARQRIRALQVALSRSDATEIERPAEAALFQATLRIRALHPECGGRIIHPTRAARRSHQAFQGVRHRCRAALGYQPRLRPPGTALHVEIQAL